MCIRDRVFGTNTSPFAGQDGKFVTARQIEERLFKETNRDVSLKIERIQNKEEWIVSGRGELHLSIFCLLYTSIISEDLLKVILLTEELKTL